MGILSFIGMAVLCLVAFSLVIGGLLNLGGCGDRIGDEYKVSNYTQITVGLMIAFLFWYLV